MQHACGMLTHDNSPSSPPTGLWAAQNPQLSTVRKVLGAGAPAARIPISITPCECAEHPSIGGAAAAPGADAALRRQQRRHERLVRRPRRSQAAGHVRVSVPACLRALPSPTAPRVDALLTSHIMCGGSARYTPQQLRHHARGP
jgi:hypothetical protein